MSFKYIFAFNFILKLFSDELLLKYVRRIYGEDGIRRIRIHQDTLRKYEKAKLDVEFLITCKTYNIFPKFLRFKLYRRSLQNSKFYKSWQSKLLNKEINLKKNSVVTLRAKSSTTDMNLQAVFSIIVCAAVRRYVKKITDEFISISKETHFKKLSNLGLKGNSLQPCDPNKVIYNFSAITLSNRLKTLLAFGLDFGLPIFKLNFFKYFLKFENLTNRIKTKFNDHENLNEVIDNIQATAFKYFYGFKSFKVFSSIFTKSDISLLKHFGSNSNIIVCKPDKGNGIVILDRNLYIDKIRDIISDTSKFCKINVELNKYVLKVETKVNNFLSKLKSLGAISDDIYKSLYVTGSGPGILYGLPKIHKPDFSVNFNFRPIFAAYSTPSFKLSKFLVPILKPLTTNTYTVDNSYTFVEDIIKVHNCDKYFMASFDIANLFTNVPVLETIDIILNHFFLNDGSIFLGMTRVLFKQLLENSVLNSFFLFDGELYQQRDGLGMGLPLGPTFANIFMCYNEQQWLNDCPQHFKPFLYKRYVDDTFLLFHDRSHVNLFLDYMNSKHPNIKFTYETEQKNKLNFLDIAIERQQTKFVTSVYRKPSFSGLGMNFFSYISDKFKFNCIDSLIYRAYRVSSNFNLFHIDLVFLRSYFLNNGFPTSLIDFRISKFLNKLYCPEQNNQPLSNDVLYFTLPYFGYHSTKMKTEIQSIFKKHFPTVTFNICLVNNFTISSLFHFKDKLPKSARSSVVYEYSCAQCASRYVGSTLRALYIRVSEHAGRSFRTNRMLTNPLNSHIRDHQQICNTPISLDNFKILATAKTPNDLRILESLYIYKQKPQLNLSQTAVKLYIVNR